MMAAGLRATAKAVEHPPEPKIDAPVLDPALVLTMPDDKSPNDIRQGEPHEGTAGSAVSGILCLVLRDSAGFARH